MKFAQDIDDQIYQVHGFTDNGIEIAVPIGASRLKSIPKIEPTDGIITLRESFVIAPLLLIDDWDVRQVSELVNEQAIASLLALDIEILILGSGERLIFPEASLLVPFMQEGIGVEVMDSRAACRTYNLLSGEGRKVAAAIILK